MLVLTEEQLKKKYLEEALATLQADRSKAVEEGFKEREWPPACSAKVEMLISMVLDLVNIGIAEMAEEEATKKNAPKKAGVFKGMIDDTVINGDYV